MNRTRRAVTLLAGAALALAVLAPASARTHIGPTAAPPATSFVWGIDDGGSPRTWHPNEQAAFTAYLAARGASYEKWAARHSTAAAIFTAAPQHLGAKYGGVLVVALGGDPDALDPTTSRTTSAVAVFGAMCQRLYDRDAKFKLVPVLAAGLPVYSKDKLSYTIELRKGVRFNDGTPFDAHAVVTTIERMMTYPGSARVSDFSAVAAVAAAGPHTVVYRLKIRDGTFNGGNPFVLSPTQLDKLGDNFATNPVCVGPFMFDHRVAGDHVTLIKSPYYYDAKDVFLDKIVYKGMPDAASAAAALKAGDIQVLSQVSSTELQAVRETSSLRVLSSPQLGYTGIYINIGNKNGVGSGYANVGTPLASSAKLRRAFEEAIDRVTLNKIVYSGLMQVSCSPIPPADTPWYGATKVPCAPYNPEHARKLVAEWGLGFLHPTIHLLTSNATDSLRKAQFIQAQEAAVGINVVIDTTDGATTAARAASGNYDTFFGGFIPGGPDPHTVTFQHLQTSGGRNYSGYSNPRLDTILNNGLKATSVRARSTLYRLAQQIIQDDRPIIYLYNPVTFAAFSTTLTGVRLTYSGGVDVANARFK